MKIINVDIDDKIQLKNIEDSKTSEIKFINSDLKLPTGNFQSILLNFNFISFTPESDLNLMANFLMSNTKKSVDVEITSVKIDEKVYEYACFIPADVFERECNITLGLYGFSLDENGELKKRISFIPETGMVVRGSYDPNSKESSMPSPTVFEAYFQEVKDINKQIANEYQGVIDEIEEIKAEHIEDFNKKVEEDKNTSLDNYLEEVKVEINNHFNEVGSTYRKDINSNTSRIKRLETDIFDSGEASGSSINIKDSTLAEFQEVVVDGVCNQETTIGKNVANVIESVDQLNQYNYLNKVNYKAKAGKYYDISFDTPNNGLRAYINLQNSFRLTLVKSDSGYEWCNLDGTRKHYKVLCTEDVEFTGATLFSRYSATSEIGTGLLTNFLMEEGTETSKPTNFEPYTGGQASPNPDYPQEIDVIEESFNVRSIGKNLIYGYATREFDQNGMNIKMEKGKSEVIINGTCEKLHSSPLGRVYLPIGKYTCSIEGINIHDSSHDRVYILDEQTSKTYGYGVQDGKPKTFEIKEAKEYRVDIVFKEGTTYENKLVKIQIEKGEVATEYEPYQETRVPIDLKGEFVGKLSENDKGQVRISFNEDDGQYHAILEKKIGKVVLDGSNDEGWTIEPLQSGCSLYSFLSNQVANLVKAESVCMSTHLSYVIDNYRADNIGVYINWQNKIRVKLGKEIDTVEKLKQYFSENNLELYYLLAEPYEIDLGVVDMPLSYYPVTNVFTTHDLQPVINAKYYRDIKNTIVTMQTDIEALKQAVATLTTSQTNLANEVDLLQEQANESEVVE